ncbi:transporter substrate-binding domain-containing protein [Cupriavidus sp. WKF15]|uniref:transporter substrate-binding domain-containing protein n=1 Tax=Cupriavidus sp. WKF15 TaxID=3032282 RepID=UPI0023E199C2|nr:transporter substrate-binding domain-containing protein [Cupriavidus sp. WKF15]WER50749.1 transporter substrate-binding domain-containing protein [Cupriavidus sp. WKF15]
MRAIPWLAAAVVGFLIEGCAGIASAPSQEERQVLAPTGKLRVALYLGAPASIVRGATLDESKGVGFDLGKEMARRIGVPFEPVVYPSPGAIMDGLKSSEWDLTIFGPTPERERVLNFTVPFLVIEHGYLVPAGSPILTIDAVDRSGTRIGVPQGGSVNASLARIIKNATLIVSPSVPAGEEMLRSGKVDVFAANKANLFGLSEKMPGSRVLDGRIGVDEVAIALPKGREPGMTYVRKFIEDAKSDGLIKAAVQRAGLRGTR